MENGHYISAGSVRITWLDVAVQSGVVGISLGSQTAISLNLQQQV